MNTRRWLAVATAGLVAGLGVGGFWAFAAFASTTAAPARATTESGFSLLIGPLKAKNGFRVEVEAVDCGAADGGVLVAYFEGNKRVTLEHTYAGAYTSCSVARTLKSATLRVRWAKVLDIDMKLATTAPVKRYAVCKGEYLEYRTAKTTGTGTFAIHASAFGTLRESTAAARDFAFVTSSSCDSDGSSSAGTLPISGTGTGSGFSATLPRSALSGALGLATVRAENRMEGIAARVRLASAATTTTVTPTTTTDTTPTSTTTTTTTTGSTTSTPPPTVTSDGSGTQFLALFHDQHLVIESQTDAPADPMTFINDTATDDPAKGVYGQMDVVVQTPQAFTVAGGDDTAQVTADAAFARGTIDFIATGACNDVSDALNGSLTGEITVKDPVFGTLTYNGPTAVGAAVGNGDADISGC